MVDEKRLLDCGLGVYVGRRRGRKEILGLKGREKWRSGVSEFIWIVSSQFLLRMMCASVEWRGVKSDWGEEVEVVWGPRMPG
jgi:hypothetical protein